MTLLFAAIVFVAFVIEAATGFGATIVTVTLASQFLPVEVVLGIFVPVNMLLSATLVARHHDAISWRLLGRLVLPFMGAGVAAGIALFQLRHHGFLRIAFGAFVVVLALVELLRRRASGPLPAWRARVALVGAGIIHGLFACGGPLAVYVLGRELPEKRIFRSTLTVLWLIFNGVLVPSYIAAGNVHAQSLRQSLWLLPALVLGLLAGEWVHHHIAPEKFRVAVWVLLLVAGAALLRTALLA